MKKFKQKAKKILKDNTKEIGFISGHLVITLILFCIFYKLNSTTVHLIDLFKESFSIILDLSIVLITIISSFAFLIKQIYFNRISGKIIYGKIKVYIYQIVILIIFIVSFSMLKYNDIASCSIYMSFIITFPLFFLWLIIDMENYDVNKFIKKKVKGVILKIEKNKDYQQELRSLSEIYLESASKNEMNICLQIIIAYSEFIINFLCGKNKKLLKYNLTEEQVSNLEDVFLEFYLRSILPDDNFETIRINMTIIRYLICLYDKVCKCEDERIISKIQTQFHYLFYFKLNNISKDYFPTFMVNFLGNPLEKDLKYFDRKLYFCVKLTIDLLQIKKIDSISFLCDYLSDFFNSGNYECELKKNLSNFLNLIRLLSFFDDNTANLRLLKSIDTFYFKINSYDMIMEFYEDVIRYKEFYDNEIVVLEWLNYFDGLIKEEQKSENFKLKYYEIYFRIIKVSIDRIEVLPVHILPQLTIDYFTKIKNNLKELLYLLSIKEKISSLRHIFVTINKLCLNLNSSDFESQKDILDMYFVSLVSSVNCSDTKLISFIISSFLELINELDKNKLISKKLAESIIENVKKVVLEFVDTNHNHTDSLMKIYFEFVSAKNDFHFVKPFKQKLYQDVFELGMKAIENGSDNFIKTISNFIGWGVQNEIEKKSIDIAKKYYRFGYDLFSTLIIVEYNKNVTNFVGTFFITILSYCYSNERDFLLIRFANEKIKEFDDMMLKVLYKAIALRKSISYTWNTILNVKFNEGLLKLCEKLGFK